MNPRLIKHLSILFFSFFILNIHSQFSISGKISDENGDPIIGASIFLKEILTGSTSDFNGNYKIDFYGEIIDAKLFDS